MGMSSSLIPKKMVVAGDIHVKKANGANARTVSEIMSMGSGLRGKTVLVRGKVVKYNADIMGKNWIHLRDGTGSVEKETNDVLVTTSGSAKLGDIITVSGVVSTDKDFGAGYAYKVLIEDATLM
jgi:DNA/RNA endonuclease YhcR with UshA esterase domain